MRLDDLSSFGSFKPYLALTIQKKSLTWHCENIFRENLSFCISDVMVVTLIDIEGHCILDVMVVTLIDIEGH